MFVAFFFQSVWGQQKTRRILYILMYVAKFYPHSKALEQKIKTGACLMPTVICTPRDLPPCLSSAYAHRASHLACLLARPLTWCAGIVGAVPSERYEAELSATRAALDEANNQIALVGFKRMSYSIYLFFVSLFPFLWLFFLLCRSARFCVCLPALFLSLWSLVHGSA